ncbi:MAG: Ig-like domain-containing protein [Candidatus Zixiibacteriota bacterium]
MNRPRIVVAICVLCGLLGAGTACAYNAVWVESKSVHPGDTDVTIGVWVVNDTPLTAFVMPLEFRDTDANGSYIMGSCVFSAPPDRRISASALTSSVSKIVYGTPTDTNCHAGGGFPLCSGPVAHAYNTSSPVDFTSPDGFLWAGVSTSAPPHLWYLPSGSDSAAGVHHGWPQDGDSTPYLAGPSFEFVFDVDSVPGSFEIDTACTCPNNHLQGTDLSFAGVMFAFRRGIVTINPNANNAPVLATIGSKTTAEGGSLAFPISASDLDGTTPLLMVANPPDHSALIDSSNGTGTFIFHPDYTQEGIYDVLFIAWDGELADGEVVTIMVAHTNAAPVLDHISPQSVNEGEHLALTVIGHDIDATVPALSALNVPLNASFSDNGDGSGSFVFDPDLSQAGDYHVTFIASDGLLADTDVVTITVAEAAAVRQLEAGDGVPAKFSLEQNYPNPFNSSTVVRFGLPHDARVRVEVFDILGRSVRTLLDEFKPLGVYAVDWDGRDNAGRTLSTGVYFCRIVSGDFESIRSMLLLK